MIKKQVFSWQLGSPLFVQKKNDVYLTPKAV
jgi:hypothetical protein